MKSTDRIPLRVLVIAAPWFLVVAVGWVSPPRASGQSIVKSQDIVYRKAGDVELRLDISAPEKAGGRRPAILFLCGNGYGHYRQNRRQFWAAMDEAAAKGYVGVSADYSSAALKVDGTVRFPFPNQVYDVKSAVRWLRANADIYGIDPERIAAVGWSSGATLALMLALTLPSDGLEGESGLSAYSSAIRCAVAFGAQTDFEALLRDGGLDWSTRDYLAGPEEGAIERYRRASPVAYVRAAAPPILLISGDQDRDIPLSQAERLAAKLDAAGCPHELVVRKGEGHRIFMGDPSVWPFLGAALAP